MLWLDGKECRAHDDAKELKLWKEEQVQESPSAPQKSLLQHRRDAREMLRGKCLLLHKKDLGGVQRTNSRSIWDRVVHFYVYRESFIFCG